MIAVLAALLELAVIGSVRPFLQGFAYGFNDVQWLNHLKTILGFSD